MNEKQTFFSNNKYRWYFYNLNYIGKIGPKRYRFKDLKERIIIYKRVSENTNVLPYPTRPVINQNEQRNTYYDLFRYYQIFNSLTENLTVFRVIDYFWSFFRPIFEDTYGKLSHKYVLLNADKFKNFKGEKIREQIKNPIFLMYYTLWKRFDLISDLDIDFLFYCNGKVMKFNPSKCDEKSYIVFLREIKKLYAVASIPVDNVKEEDIKKEEEPVSEPEVEKEVTPVRKSEEEIPKENISVAKTSAVSKIVEKIGNSISEKLQTKLSDKIEKANQVVSKRLSACS